MLRITVYDDDRLRTLRLEGSIRGPWVGELERVWQKARSTAAGVHIRADVRMVSFVDEEGKHLLRQMDADGVQLIAAGAMMRAIVQEIVQHRKTAHEKAG
jgi:hypothetical protein